MMGPRAKFLGLAALFALPIAASIVAYNVVRPDPTGNFGELLLPPAAPPAQSFATPEGKPFTFQDLAGKWAMVTADSGECAQACRGKLTTMRQVRLALGRNAGRVERVWVVDDGRAPPTGALDDFRGTTVALKPSSLTLPLGPATDRAHIYLVDPRGNVMMRWPANSDGKRILSDLQKLLKASQIG